MNAGLLADFSRITPALNVITDHERLRPFETDAFISHRAVPMCAILPEDETQVAAILASCSARGVPVVTRGAGTGISGGAIPSEDGVLLVLTRMNHIGKVDHQARTATVGPGVRNLAVSDAAAAHNLFYAPDPSSQLICSIGGNVAENSGGVHCLKYGLTTHNVLQVRLVLSGGESMTLGSRALDAAGYDLMAVVTGSEGMLGLVTEVVVKLTPVPEHVETLLAAFPSVTDAANAVGRIIGAGVVPAALEMMDKMVIEACEKFMSAGFPLDAEALLLIELDGVREEVADQLVRVEQVLNDCHAQEIRRAKSDAEREKLWKARKGAFAALATIRPDYYTIDGTIPRRCLPDVLARYTQLAEEYRMLVANVFHAGDGNLHPCIFYDATVPGEMERSEELGGKMLEICVEVGGTITGEHGVGVEKLRQMCVQFREAELATFHAIKAAFDPAGILNPGKGVPSLKRCAEWGGMHVREGKMPRADIPRF
ncbi:MAG: FAD-binding protein [Betaproteobacteria bacterium]|nr:FAD-binding protein [Betaproteobacteria bacterium]